MAHGIVSLLDAASEQATRALWAELDARYGLREVTQRVPWPHFSYHIAEDYDLARLAEPLRRVATQTEPFAVTISGLGGFAAPEPALYLAVERNATLDALHAALWHEMEHDTLAQRASPFYAPEPWQPHITLAQRDLSLETLRAIQAKWAGRDLRRTLWVDNLTLLYRVADATTNEPTMRFSLGSANNTANG
jgi:2'-5' RNA ligase